LRKRKLHEIMRVTDYAALRISPKIGATSLRITQCPKFFQRRGTVAAPLA
jgi:hypothetical protein